MGKINLLIANANQKFTNGELTIFQKAAAAANEFISNNFVFDYDVDVVVTAPSFLMSTVPEDGICGRTYNSQLIILVVDKQQLEISEDIIFETICHEMSHSLRWEKLPEYSDTLFKGLILEGLGVALEAKAMTDSERQSKQYFLTEMQSTDQVMINSILAQLSDLFDKERYDYDMIFYTGNDTLPRWAGYRLGHYFVNKHLQQTGTTIFEATLASYNSFKP
jgi:uncharacterized protein YjaZ